MELRWMTLQSISLLGNVRVPLVPGLRKWRKLKERESILFKTKDLLFICWVACLLFFFYKQGLVQPRLASKFGVSYLCLLPRARLVSLHHYTKLYEGPWTWEASTLPTELGACSPSCVCSYPVLKHLSSSGPNGADQFQNKRLCLQELVIAQLCEKSPLPGVFPKIVQSFPRDLWKPAQWPKVFDKSSLPREARKLSWVHRTFQFHLLGKSKVKDPLRGPGQPRGAAGLCFSFWILPRMTSPSWIISRPYQQTQPHPSHQSSPHMCTLVREPISISFVPF